MASSMISPCGQARIDRAWLRAWVSTPMTNGCFCATIAMAVDVPAALKAIDTARAAAREQAWRLAGEHAPDHGSDAKQPLIIDLDATLVTSHLRRRMPHRRSRSGSIR